MCLERKQRDKHLDSVLPTGIRVNWKHRMRQIEKYITLIT